MLHRPFLLCRLFVATKGKGKEPPKCLCKMGLLSLSTTMGVELFESLGTKLKMFFSGPPGDFLCSP